MKKSQVYLRVQLGLIADRVSRSKPSISYSQNHYASSSSPGLTSKPNVPLRIKRGSTDLLKALASTVERVPTAPAYKFYDDPYLYPLSTVNKKTYALSMESGKKAARYIKDTYPQYFTHQPDDPVIKEFAPKVKFDENSEISETDLLNTVKNLQVSQSAELYRLCETKNIEVSADTRQALLELMCFYNEEDPVDPAWLEEISNQRETNLPRPVTTWKDAGLAEELFNSLRDDKRPDAYGALIKGMCKYYKAERAWQLFEECVAADTIPDVGTYNAILGLSHLLRDDTNSRWSLVTELLTQMAQKNVQPNLGTLNAILETLYQMRRSEQTKNLALKVLAEFKVLNIKPSLASYYFLLHIHYAPKNVVKPFLPSLLDVIEHETFTIEDPRDILFFCNAMNVCKKYLQSFQVAQRLLQMLQNEKNIDLLGTGITENIFYRNYFLVAANSLPMKEFMEIYDEAIPHVYSMEREVAMEIVKNIGVHDAVQFLPRIWSDATMLKQSRGESFMEAVLMVASSHDLEGASPELREQLTNIAWDIWSKVQDTERDKKIEWSGQMLGDCISILVRGGDLERGIKIMRIVVETDIYLVGELPFRALKVFFDAVSTEKLFSDALLVAKYAKDNEYPDAVQLVKLMYDIPDLPESIKMKLKVLFEESLPDDKLDL